MNGLWLCLLFCLFVCLGPVVHDYKQCEMVPRSIIEVLNNDILILGLSFFFLLFCSLCHFFSSHLFLTMSLLGWERRTGHQEGASVFFLRALFYVLSFSLSILSSFFLSVILYFCPVPFFSSLSFVFALSFQASKRSKSLKPSRSFIKKIMNANLKKRSLILIMRIGPIALWNFSFCVSPRTFSKSFTIRTEWMAQAGLPEDQVEVEVEEERANCDPDKKKKN